MTTFYDCPTHGAIEVRDVRDTLIHRYDCKREIDLRQPGYVCPEHGNLGSILHTAEVFLCRQCGQRCRERRIDFHGGSDRVKHAGGRVYCLSCCTNGKRSCDCNACKGKCHSAGTCPGH